MGPEPTVLSGRLERGADGPVLALSDRTLSWAEVGKMLVAGGAVEVVIAVTPATSEEVVVVERPPTVVSGEATHLALRGAVDEAEAERWREAVALLDECLPPAGRWPCPAGELAGACVAARAGVTARLPVWRLVAEAAGWVDGPPADDVDLWTGAALALVSVAVDGLDPDTAQCLDAMELDDWLATVVELVRAGAGAPAQPEHLLELSAGCLDVDSGAADPALAPMLDAAFRTILPIWEALGAVDGDGRLTALGAWGLPLALARAWGGWLT